MVKVHWHDIVTWPGESRFFMELGFHPEWQYVKINIKTFKEKESSFCEKKLFVYLNQYGSDPY